MTHVRARFAPVLIAVLGLALAASPVAATSPTFDSFSDGPFDDVVVDCGSYEIHEVSTFSARSVSR